MNKLQDASTIDLAQVMAEINSLRAENTALKQAKASKGLGIKVSEKGAVSVYGLGRFPVTLYHTQWTALFQRQVEIEKFIADNMTQLQAIADSKKVA